MNIFGGFIGRFPPFAQIDSKLLIASVYDVKFDNWLNIFLDVFYEAFVNQNVW